MRKLALKVDDLRVDSFETVEAPEGRGTVAAHARTEDLNCTGDCPSAQPTCGIVPATFEADCYPAKPGGGGGEYSLDLPCCV
jgi:hypothetical protein